MITVDKTSTLLDRCVARKSYQPPQLIAYGSVAVLTKAGSAGNTEFNAGGPCSNSPIQARVSPTCSDIRCKENIVRVGTHAGGFGLYMYNYRSEFTHRAGAGKFLGVMAQELLSSRPDAVLLEDSGYYAVNYSALESMTV